MSKKDDDKFSLTPSRDWTVSVDSSKNYTIRMPPPRRGMKLRIDMQKPPVAGGGGLGGAVGTMSGPGSIAVMGGGGAASNLGGGGGGGGGGGFGGNAGGNGGSGSVTLHFKDEEWGTQNLLEPLELEDFCAIAALQVALIVVFACAAWYGHWH